MVEDPRVAAGFLAFAAIVVSVLVITLLIRPFDLAATGLATMEAGDSRALP